MRSFVAENRGVDREQVFDEDYLYFYEPWQSDEANDREAELVWELLELLPGDAVLDLACGHGRIANRLAERGARVTGLDATPKFLELARADAARRGVDVEYLEGDMRELRWSSRFDAVLNWFTSFGYFDDADNRRVLEQAYESLKPGGRLLIENNNAAAVLRTFVPAIVNERDGDLLIDRFRLELSAGQIHTDRTVVRNGRTRSFSYDVRLFWPPELASWLRDVGFSEVRTRSHDGELTIEQRRMVTIARK
jgi:SAM-dependent methyltransferase